jgi:hypothetical protein
MTDRTVIDELYDEAKQLDEENQRVLLAIARLLAQPKGGTPGYLAKQYAREIGFSSEALAEMQQAIEEACEQIDDFPEVHFDE